MAEAVGGRGVRIEKPGDLAGAFEGALKSGTPTVLDVIINRDTTSTNHRHLANAASSVDADSIYFEA